MQKMLPHQRESVKFLDVKTVNITIISNIAMVEVKTGMNADVHWDEDGMKKYKPVL